MIELFTFYFCLFFRRPTLNQAWCKDIVIPVSGMAVTIEERSDLLFWLQSSLGGNVEREREREREREKRETERERERSERQRQIERERELSWRLHTTMLCNNIIVADLVFSIELFHYFLTWKCRLPSASVQKMTRSASVGSP